MSGCARAVVVVAVSIGLSAPASAQTGPTLATVLERAAAYVVEFQSRLSGIVAEERYVQNIMAPLTARVRHRELVSDLLLVRPVGADRWIQFRDVLHVDGKPVRDRTDRLAKLFLEPTRSTAEQIHSIVADSARYNIGGVVRTVNVPVMPLVFLEPARQTRFTFSRSTNNAPSLSFARNPATAWTIQYQEADRDTIIRGTNGYDLPARGRFWIEPDTGRVLMSELMTQDAVLRAVIVVQYVEEQTVGLLVPREMRERYNLHDRAIRDSGSEVDGTATYSKFRQFTVTVDETLRPVVKP